MPLLSKNIQLKPAMRLSPWRKIALGTWRTAKDPSVYGILEVRAEPLLKYMNELRGQSEIKVTLTHILGKAMGKVLRTHPQINCVMRWGKLYPRENVDIFFQVASDAQGNDLSGITIRNIDQKTVQEIAKEMDTRVEKIRSKKEMPFARMKELIGDLPSFFSRLILDFGHWFGVTMNLWSPALGVPKDAFGCMMLTNIGSLGLEFAFAPLVPYSGVGLLIAMGAVKDQPVVEDGKVVVGKVLKLGVTFDHRLIDGVHAAKMASSLQELLKSPAWLDLTK